MSQGAYERTPAAPAASIHPATRLDHIPLAFSLSLATALVFPFSLFVFFSFFFSLSLSLSLKRTL